MSLTPDRNDPRIHQVRADGQNEAYLILSDEERAKGFVRPVRRSYVHVDLYRPKGPQNPLRPLTEEEKIRYAADNYVAYEAYPNADSPVVGCFWTQEKLDEAKRSCGALTTMALALAETYARNPKFYGATFCTGCGKHLPVEEFVWDGTSERVGS